jgi:hypothetical protein
MVTPSATQTVAAIVTRTMAQQDISVKSLAESTTIPRTTLTRRLGGHSPFTINELGLIASVLGTTASRIAAEAERAAA